MWSTLVSVIWTFIKKLFGNKPDENTQAVEVSNKINATSEQVARDTRAQVQQDEAKNDQQTAIDAARVRDASSLRDGSDAINDAIARANSHIGTNR